MVRCVPYVKGNRSFLFSFMRRLDSMKKCKKEAQRNYTTLHYTALYTPSHSCLILHYIFYAVKNHLPCTHIITAGFDLCLCSLHKLIKPIDPSHDNKKK